MSRIQNHKKLFFDRNTAEIFGAEVETLAKETRIVKEGYQNPSLLFRGVYHSGRTEDCIFHSIDHEVNDQGQDLFYVTYITDLPKGTPHTSQLQAKEVLDYLNNRHQELLGPNAVIAKR